MHVTFKVRKVGVDDRGYWVGQLVGCFEGERNVLGTKLDVWGGCIDMIDMRLLILGIYLVQREWCRLGWVRSQFLLVKVSLNDDLDVGQLSGSDGPTIGTGVRQWDRNTGPTYTRLVRIRSSKISTSMGEFPESRIF